MRIYKLGSSSSIVQSISPWKLYPFENPHMWLLPNSNSKIQYWRSSSPLVGQGFTLRRTSLKVLLRLPVFEKAIISIKTIEIFLPDPMDKTFTWKIEIVNAACWRHIINFIYCSWYKVDGELVSKRVHLTWIDHFPLEINIYHKNRSDEYLAHFM